ncbi:dihydrofolate reductase family protein [Streptomyces sp. NPDC020192]|uniref:dihydrofolate reductase family protein n=1 Tax=Streptomyces sp. NPDC020192 TaxID=3365066 RepID=UPI0037900341
MEARHRLGPTAPGEGRHEDGPYDLRVRPAQRPLALAGPPGVRARLPPAGTPDHVVTDSDPARLLEKLRAANRGGDVHLVGGPRTIQAFHALGALDTLEVVVVPLLFGDGMRLTATLSPTIGLTCERRRALPGGAVEIVYACEGSRPPLPDAPASQR